MITITALVYRLLSHIGFGVFGLDGCLKADITYDSYDALYRDHIVKFGALSLLAFLPLTHGTQYQNECTYIFVSLRSIM